MKKIIKAICICGAILCLISVENKLLECGNFPLSELLGLVAGSLFPYLYMSIVDLYDTREWKSSQTRLRRAGFLKKNTPIRISFAYLFRIKVDGKYFLVRNQRTNKYQPVRGAYKFTKNEADFFRNNIPVENDDCIPVNQLTDYDYRLLVRNSDLRKFVKRFDKTKNRENIMDLSREFKEELFSTNIIDKQDFGNLVYNYCGRHMTEVKYGNIFKHYELLLADIVEVDLNDYQKEIFRSLMKHQNEKFVFATADEIKNFGVRIGTNDLADNIADHCLKILSSESNSLINKKKYKDKITVKI